MALIKRLSDYVLPFGKYRGQSLSKVPATYLKFLCCTENVRRDGKVVTEELFVNHGHELFAVPGSQRYILEKQWLSMIHARRYAKDSRLCLECFRPLVPVGGSRRNGACHNDWETRRFHKRCWSQIEEIVSEESAED